MSLDELRTHIDVLEYQPQSAKISFSAELFSVLSLKARVFVRLMTDKLDEGYLTTKELYGTRWSDDPSLLRRYEQLDESEKTEVLSIVTMDLHEATHHIDFMLTPFGANFHGKSCLEYLAFQEFVPELLKYPEFVSKLQPLVNFDDFLDTCKQKVDSKLLTHWHDLRGKIKFFDIYFHDSKKQITSGWGSRNDPALLLGGEYSKIVVENMMPTISLPNVPKSHIRPRTILEARALIHALRWIAYLFGYKEGSQIELARYLEAFYFSAPDKIKLDYTFLFKLFAKLWERDNFAELVRTTHIKALDQILILISAICWYALQAPPLMGDDATSVLNSNPVFRLLYALKRGEIFLTKNSKPYKYIAEFLEEIETKDTASSRPIRENLEYSQRYVNYIRQKNMAENQNPVMARHFDQILGIQSRQLGQRIPLGYVSEIAMPENGNPLKYIFSEQDADDLYMTEYSPEREVLSWFTFRENLLFKFGGMRAEAIKEELQKRFVFPTKKSLKEKPTMSLKDQGQQRLIELTYRMAKCLQMMEVPLFMATEQDQWTLVRWLTTKIGGTVMYANAADAPSQFLNSLNSMNYLFLLIQEEFSNELFPIIQDYILNSSREEDRVLTTQSARYAIHAEHRLILFIDRQTFTQLRGDMQQTLKKLCTLINVV